MPLRFTRSNPSKRRSIVTNIIENACALYRSLSRFNTFNCSIHIIRLVRHFSQQRTQTQRLDARNANHLQPSARGNDKRTTLKTAHSCLQAVYWFDSCCLSLLRGDRSGRPRPAPCPNSPTRGHPEFCAGSCPQSCQRVCCRGG